ncbi:transposase [Spirosoma litoris]
MAQLAIHRLTPWSSSSSCSLAIWRISILIEKLIEHCSMRMDMLYFLGYNIDESLPWHSTLSRTRQLYPESLFELLFNKVFSLCVAHNMTGCGSRSADRYRLGSCQSERVDGNTLRKTAPAIWAQITTPS